MKSHGTARTVSLAALLLLVLALPLFMITNQYSLILLTTVVLYGALASAWNIIGGMAGQFDLAAGAYLGLGAFTSATMLIRWNITPWVGMAAGGLVAALFALLIGYPLFRFKVREVWYALSSAALVLVLQVGFLMWDKVGGPTERYIPFHDWSLYHLRFRSYIPFYYLILLILLLTLWINRRIRSRRLGYYLLALGDNEEAAEILGVDARGSKLKALVIYAFIVGMLGAVYACLYGYIHPNFFSSGLSLEVAILGIVGGVGFTYGPLLAAVILVSGKELLRANLGGQMESLYLAIYAIVLILIALFRPKGLASLLQQAWSRLSSRAVKE